MKLKQDGSLGFCIQIMERSLLYLVDIEESSSFLIQTEGSSRELILNLIFLGATRRACPGYFICLQLSLKTTLCVFVFTNILASSDSEQPLTKQINLYHRENI